MYKKNNTPIKRSFGVCCCRFNPNTNEVEAIMVRKRVSYYYVEFVMKSQYGKSDEEIISILNFMTCDEKFDLLSLDYTHIYHRIWMVNPEINSTTMKQEHYDRYLHLKHEFTKTFSVDKGKRLKDLINRSNNIESLWEIPKGHKCNPQEKELNCALREFEEETGIPSSDYKILDEHPFALKYTSAKVNYHNMYYLAIIENDKWMDSRNLKVDYKNISQFGEIGDIRWMDINKVKASDYTGRLAPMLQKLFRILRRKYKIHKLTKYHML
jgi:8-oxo-dGTP pyrophosphatase MutT (NUDIX family)